MNVVHKIWDGLFAVLYVLFTVLLAYSVARCVTLISTVNGPSIPLFVVFLCLAAYGTVLTGQMAFGSVREVFGPLFPTRVASSDKPAVDPTTAATPPADSGEASDSAKDA